MGAKNEVIEQELDLDNPGKPVVDDGGFETEVEIETPKAESASPVEEDDIDVEIVDDTPPEDRGRKPLPEEKLKELEEDSDVEEYSEKVKRRINEMRKAWHDERRAREAAQRERDEAARIAQMAYQERQLYLQQLQQGETWALEQAKRRAELEVEAAKAAYRAAYESGDTDKVVEAQAALNQAMYQHQQVSGLTPRYQHVPVQKPETMVNSQQGQPTQQYRAPEPDPRAREWNEANKWFGEDDEMTSFALGVHQKLVREGVDPRSDEYYERIDARMREVFPDKFGIKKRQPSTVVAPVGRSPKGKKVVLTQTQVALAKRLGITPEQYARELVKQMEK